MVGRRDREGGLASDGGGWAGGWAVMLGGGQPCGCPQHLCPRALICVGWGAPHLILFSVFLFFPKHLFLPGPMVVTVGPGRKCAHADCPEMPLHASASSWFRTASTWE